MMWSNWVYNTKGLNDWNPRYDFFESEGVDRLNVEMPGVSRSDVKVNLQGRLLTVDAKRNVGRGDQKWTGKWILPDSVSPELVEARLESGILSVSFPPLEKLKSRDIEVQ